MSKFVSKSYSLLILFATIMTAVLFATVAATAQTYTPLFTYPNGSRNNSGIGWPQLMAQGRDGSLYSTDADEGTPGQGLIYKMSTGGQFTNLYTFCPQAGCADGAVPEGGLTLGFDGNFYGTTAGGGQGGAGTVFKVTPTGAISTLHLFANGTDDSAPAFALTQDKMATFTVFPQNNTTGRTEPFSRSAPTVSSPSPTTSSIPTVHPLTFRYRGWTDSSMEPRSLAATQPANVEWCTRRQPPAT